jgi:hypothetical protein
MDAADLRKLAQEREARHGVPKPAARAVPAASHVRPSAAQLSKALLSTHRSIKLARSLGFAMSLTSGLLLLLGCGRITVGVVGLGGVGLARGGAAWLHGLLPPMLIETPKAPSAAEMAMAASIGLYCLEGVKTFGSSVQAEATLALDSLAYACTYGKKNCLTNAMYTGDLSLGKIVGLVWGKLREGVVRC